MVASRYRTHLAWLMVTSAIIIFSHTQQESVWLLPFLDEISPPKVKAPTENQIRDDGSISSDRNSSGFVPITKHGTFGGLPVRFVNHSQPSQVHCIGENFRPPEAWKFRSCHFRHMCWDVKSHEFVLFANAQDEAFRDTARKNLDTFFSSNMHALSVSHSAYFMKWARDEGVDAWHRWSPRILPIPDGGYYALPSDVVWVPWIPRHVENPGHILWDNFLPIYTLLSSFGLEEDFRLVLARLAQPVPRACYLDQRTCNMLLNKFLPLLGVASTHELIEVNTAPQFYNDPKSNYVCAEHGAAGLGMLTDHGTASLGSNLEGRSSDVYTNFGRGAHLYRFRNHMLTKVGIQDLPRRRDPYQILVSIHSSRKASRNFGLESQIQFLRESFPVQEVDVQDCRMGDLNLNRQLELTMQSSIYIAVNGGGSSTALFLPRGSTLILYYQDDPPQKRILMDADFWNNCGYLKVHWLPLSKKDQQLDILIELVRKELNDIIRVEG